jgi:hypothetical protein
MRATCASPLSLEVLVDYWADELDATQTERVDEHLMACDVCSLASARVAAIREAIRLAIPPFVSQTDVDTLRARGLRIVENPVAAGERIPALFGADVDILLHRLGGLDLREVESIRVVITVEETGAVVLDQPLTPFERDTGEILVACQRHFGTEPRTVVFEVHARERWGTERVSSFAIPHVYER